MKVVCCKNCGAKYQLEDDDDITTFECSSCAGDLEYLEDYSNEENGSRSSFIDSFKYDNSQIVQCEDCGLKYKIKSSDRILDYECDSCGGSLRYLDEDLNKELDEYIEERRKEINIIREETKPENEIPEDEEQTEDNTRSLKSITGRLENFFSEEHMLEIAKDEKKEEELKLEDELSSRTARTTIPENVLSKFGREFAVPKTNDYNILKNFHKNEFFKGMNEYYPQTMEKPTERSFGGFIDRLSIPEPDAETGSITGSITDNGDSDFDIKNLDTNTTILLIGAVIFILSIIEILLFNSGIGIVAIFIGVIILCYGLYKTRDVKETEIRTKIIRDPLLTLSDEYYVFYNVKTPTSKASINHLVVGPTGIYALLSQKYNPKLRLESENENLSLISANDEEDKIEEFYETGNMKRFRYTTKQAKFSQDNKIKQKALSLGEDLINFLNDNNIKNCFVEPLVGFINNEVVVINMPLTDEDLFIEELLNQIETSTIKLDSETIDKCAVLINNYSADCSSEI